MNESTQYWLQLGAAFLGGGAMGAVINTAVAAYRGRVQPVARRVEVSPFFTSSKAPGSFNASITINAGTQDFKFPNLHVAEILLVNLGNRDLPSFEFGLTFAPTDKAIHAEPFGNDRYHRLTLKSPCTPESPVSDVDVELAPFNRRDSYTMKVFFTSESGEPGEIALQTAAAVRFTDIPSLADTFAGVAASVPLKVGPFEARFGFAKKDS